MQQKELETFYADSREAWRQWLMENHRSKHSIWLEQYKKKSGKPTISWSEAVDEALCFGWIDSQRRGLDALVVTDHSKFGRQGLVLVDGRAITLVPRGVLEQASATPG